MTLGAVEDAWQFYSAKSGTSAAVAALEPSTPETQKEGVQKPADNSTSTPDSGSTSTPATKAGVPKAPDPKGAGQDDKKGAPKGGTKGKAKGGSDNHTNSAKLESDVNLESPISISDIAARLPEIKPSLTTNMLTRLQCLSTNAERSSPLHVLIEHSDAVKKEKQLVKLLELLIGTGQSDPKTKDGDGQDCFTLALAYTNRGEKLRQLLEKVSQKVRSK